VARDPRRSHEPGWAVLRTCERRDEVENLTRVDVVARAAVSGRESSKTPEGRRAGEAWSVRGPRKVDACKPMGGGERFGVLPGSPVAMPWRGLKPRRAAAPGAGNTVSAGVGLRRGARPWSRATAARAVAADGRRVAGVERRYGFVRREKL
jgi:hypothetical protein